MRYSLHITLCGTVRVVVARRVMGFLLELVIPLQRGPGSAAV